MPSYSSPLEQGGYLAQCLFVKNNCELDLFIDTGLGIYLRRLVEIKGIKVPDAEEPHGYNCQRRTDISQPCVCAAESQRERAYKLRSWLLENIYTEDPSVFGFWPLRVVLSKLGIDRWAADVYFLGEAVMQDGEKTISPAVPIEFDLAYELVEAGLADPANE